MVVARKQHQAAPSQIVHPLIWHFSHSDEFPTYRLNKMYTVRMSSASGEVQFVSDKVDPRRRTWIDFICE